jgi:glucose-1-phosphate thymidylyltransferase
MSIKKIVITGGRDFIGTNLIKYLITKNFEIHPLGRESSWLDTGNCDDILRASNYISIIENRQNLKISCIEEIAYKKKFISRSQLKKRIKFYERCSYSDYLTKLI